VSSLRELEVEVFTAMIATRNSLPQSPSAEPAANALAHGMTARRFVAPDQAERMLAIRAHLFAIYEPASSEEVHCLEDLSLAQAQLYDVEVAAWERLEWEKSHARERFDRRMRDQFEKDLAACRENPYVWLDILAVTWLGASHMARIWAEIADHLERSQGSCPLDRIRDAVASRKSEFDVDRICFEGRWILQRHLAIAHDPAAELEAWLECTRTGADEPRADQRSRARWILEHAPDPATARRELLENAITERDRWALKANDLRSRYETDRDLAADRAVFFVPSDEKATRESRLALRYLTAARNRVDKLERRFEALRKLRPVRNLRKKNDFANLPRYWTPVPGPGESQIRNDDPEIEEEETAEVVKNASGDARLAAIDREFEALEAELAAEEAAWAEQEARWAEEDLNRKSTQALDSKADEPDSVRSSVRRADPAKVARAFRKKMAKK